MAYTFTEKKRIRKSFSTRSAADQVPNLLDIQKASYKKLPQIGRHTSELQSHHDLVCRLLLEKKKNNSSRGSRWRLYTNRFVTHI